MGKIISMYDLTKDEKTIIDIYRSLNKTGQDIFISFAKVSSSNFSSSKGTNKGKISLFLPIKK